MGVGHFDHTNCFFANSEKTAARSGAVFLHTFLYINFAPFQKISTQGHLRSGHQVRSSAPTSKKYLWFRRDYSFSCINMKLSGVDKGIPTKRISRNFDFGDPMSGQFWDLTIIRQWENVHMPLFRKYEWQRAIYVKIFLHWATPDDPYAVLTQWPLLQVIRGHTRSHSCFAPKFW